jgi:photosystem II stability/assembly factor-like uncharacterized protein
MPQRLVRAILAAACFALAWPLHGQFTLLHSNTTASLRGIADVDGRVAWASGAAGTVLRTLDNGNTWLTCTVPPNAEKLDFRGIVAFDDKTALVMSSGKGDASRIYKTADGCATWQLVLANPVTPDGFFDALYFNKREDGWLLGDPVDGKFYLLHTENGGTSWDRSTTPSLAAPAGAGGAFAASNQSFALSNRGPIFGGGGGYIYRGTWPSCSLSIGYNEPEKCLDHMDFHATQLPGLTGSAGAGIFAIFETPSAMVAVGGDYTAPDSAAHTAAFSLNDGTVWTPSATPPHGYRSTVVYDVNTRTWITTGPNGTDISQDNGNHWQPLLPDASKGDTPDADKNWNALSLPFVVGPKGRIGRLRDDAIPIPSTGPTTRR